MAVLVASISWAACGPDAVQGSSVQAPPESITVVEPASAPVGSGELTVTIRGSGFDGEGVIQSVVYWYFGQAATALVTHVISGTELTAVVPAEFLRSPGTASLVVALYDTMEKTVRTSSNSLGFQIWGPGAGAGTGIAFITGLEPASAVAGSGDLTVRILGTGLQPGHKVYGAAVWRVGGLRTRLATSWVSGSELTAVVPAALLASPVSASITVEFSDMDGNPKGRTNGFVFTVSPVPSPPPVKGRFKPTGGLSIGRSGHIATLLRDGRVLVLGGGESSAEVFDPATGRFTLTGSMSIPRWGATATLLVDGRVLVAGGYGPYDGAINVLRSSEIYDPVSGTFSDSGSMVNARVLHAATLLPDGRVLVTGGMRAGGGGGAAIGSAEVFDPSSGRFSPVGSMVSDRAQHVSSLLPSEKVLIAGGWNGHRADAADDPPWDPLFNELFDPGTDTFSAAAAMSTTRPQPTAVQLADGRVLLLGGYWRLQNLHRQPGAPRYAEVYDGSKNSVAPVGGVVLATRRYTATLSGTDQVLVVGGEVGGARSATVTVVDVPSATVLPAGELASPRVGHTATRLADGRILVVGGTGATGEALSSAELFE